MARAVQLLLQNALQTQEKLKPRLLLIKSNRFPISRLFFSAIGYQQLQTIAGAPVSQVINKETTVFLLTGIANPAPLVMHLNTLTTNIRHHKYPDHHPFTLKNISKLAAEFEADLSSQKIIITTEKDAQRLSRLYADAAALRPACVCDTG